MPGQLTKTSQDLFEVHFDECGRFKKGDVTYGYNLAGSDVGLKYLWDNGVIIDTTETEERLFSKPVTVSTADLDALNTQITELQKEKDDLLAERNALQKEKDDWTAIAANPVVKKAIDAIPPAK